MIRKKLNRKGESLNVKLLLLYGIIYRKSNFAFKLTPFLKICKKKKKKLKGMQKRNDTVMIT